MHVDSSAAGDMLYLRFFKRARVPRTAPVRLGQIAALLGDPHLEKQLAELIVYRPEPQGQDGTVVLIDMLTVLREVRKIVPDVQVELYGDPHALVEFKENKPKPKLIIVLFVWFLLFVGSGLAIMNFHADVSMEQVHRNVYRLVTGKEEDHPYVLQIPYSIGLGIGMILFFNRLFKRRFNDEPTPLEVELFAYQETVQQVIITDEYKRLREREASGDPANEIPASPKGGKPHA